MEKRSEAIAREVRALHELPVHKEYRPEFLAEGGDQFVFTLPEYPCFVAKIRKAWLKQLALCPEMQSTDFAVAPPEYKGVILEKLEDERRRFRDLKKYFGSMTLREFFPLVTLPLEEPVLRVLFSKEKPVPPFPQKISLQIPIRIQERKELKKGEFVSLHSAYLGVPGEMRLSQFFDSLWDIFSQKKPHPPNLPAVDLIKKIRTIFPDSRLVGLVMKDFVERAARYTQETDQILDMAGANNIVLDRDEKGLPHIALIDAISSLRVTFSEVHGALIAVEKRTLSGRERDVLKDGLHYARLMVGLAHEYAPACVSAFQLPELLSEKIKYKAYRALYYPDA